MAIKSRENSFGAWAFLIGVILALIIGIATTITPIPFVIAHNTLIYSLLMILGIIIGFINVNEKDTQTFLIAGTIVVIVSQFGMDSISKSLIGIGEAAITFSAIFAALVALFIPATIIVALRTLFSIAKI